MTTGTEPATGYTYEQVQYALNRAADDVLSAVDAPDTGTPDVINLLVNAAGAYLTGTADTLEQVAAAAYDIDDDDLTDDGALETPRTHLDVVLDWCAGN